MRPLLTGDPKNHTCCMIDVAMNEPGYTTSTKCRTIVAVDMSAFNIEIKFDSAAAAKAYWIKQTCKCGNKFEVRYCSSKANYGWVTRIMCVVQDKQKKFCLNFRFPVKQKTKSKNDDF